MVAPEDWVELGRLGRPQGLKGWLHLESWTDPSDALLNHAIWHLRTAHGFKQQMTVAESRRQSKGWIVRLESVTTREGAEVWVNALIELPREQLPPAPAGEYYRSELIGFRVFNLEQVDFGLLERFEDMPASAVMVVRGERERWLPVTPQHLRRIDPELRSIWVDWPEDF